MSPKGTVGLVAAVLASMLAGLATAKDCSPPAASCALVPAESSAVCSSYFSSNKIKTTSCTSTVTVAPSTSTKTVNVMETTTTTVSTTSTRVIDQTRHRSSTSVTTTTSTTTDMTTTGRDTSTITSTDTFTSTATAVSTATSFSVTTSRLPARKLRRGLAEDCDCFKTETIIKTTTLKAATTTLTSTLSTSTKTVVDKSATTITVSNVGTTLTFTETSTDTLTSSTTTTVPLTIGESITVPTTLSTTSVVTATSTITVPAAAPLGTSGYLEMRPPVYYVGTAPAKYCLSDAAGHLTDNANEIDHREFFIVTPEQKLYSVTHNSYYIAYTSGMDLIYWVTGATSATTNFFVDQSTQEADGSVRLRIRGSTPGTYLNTCMNGDGGTTGHHVYAYPSNVNHGSCAPMELWLTP